MKTKIVYVLVSSHQDYFLEQALMSAHSLRTHNPDASIELVIDSLTEATLHGQRSKIREYVDNIIIADVPQNYDNMLRSRYLKTQLRHLVKGDFLFVDCDTVICKNLDSIDSITTSIGMVADLNGHLILSDANTIKKGLNAGFKSFEGEPYFNSGIILVKDHPICYDFYNSWHRNWLHSMLNGVPNDQPALCETNRQSGHLIEELDASWNCQIKFYGSPKAKDAFIIHYYSSKAITTPSAENMLYYIIKDKGAIDKTLDNILGDTELLCTLLTIRPDKSYQYLSSPLINVFFNQNRLFKFSEKFTLLAFHFIKRIHKLIK